MRVGRGGTGPGGGVSSSILEMGGCKRSTALLDAAADLQSRLCVCACMCVHVRACVRACACLRACVCVGPGAAQPVRVSARASRAAYHTSTRDTRSAHLPSVEDDVEAEDDAPGEAAVHNRLESKKS